MKRRRFMQRVALAGAALYLPRPLQADPYQPFPSAPLPSDVVRVRGRVRAAGRGLPDVAITDGLTVVTTAKNGAFELIARARQPFVYLSVPAGYQLPRNPTGTVRFYQLLLPNAKGEMEANFDLEPLEGGDEQHAFFVLADPQTEDDYEMKLLHAQTVPDVRAAVASLAAQPLFGVACGDIMFDNLSMYPDYERAVTSMGLPFFQVVGNHDLNFEGLTDAASTNTFSRHFGPTYYSFDRGAVHYVVLDDVFWHHAGYFGYLDADQLSWLEQDLARIEAGRPVVVFTHIPALSSTFLREGLRSPDISVSITNRDALYRLLEPYQAHIISGHTHENEHVYEGGVHEYVLGAACGAWWSGPICRDGSPNGYGIFEVNGEDLRWQYKSTGHPHDHQMRIYAHGADPTAPDEIVANVWGWDPAWTVVWYEDGMRRGTMAHRIGTDPLSERLHRGPDLPARRSWVDPVRTNHLFYAPASRTATDVHVEATDPWGRTYTAVLRA